MQGTIITKNNGDQELFNTEKLVRSLKKSLATDAEIQRVVERVNQNLYPGIPTGEIYALAHKTLKSFQSKNPNAIRYALRQSVMELGPSGFPFEKFVARIFTERGYMCQTGVMVQGHCIEHEVDILAYNDTEVLCIEAKFHNEPYMKSDTKVALYVKARFDDLTGQKIYLDGKHRNITRGVLITNTNFTDNAQSYVSCIGTFDLISWNHPPEKGLLHFIEEYNLHPVTALPDLSKKDIERLISQEVLLCSDIRENPGILDKIGLRKSKKEAVLETIALVCKR